jgi:hypothetical protein
MTAKTEMLLNFENATPTILGTRPPLPVLVCRNGQIVGDADVEVSPRDPNWYRGRWSDFDGKIQVRKPIRLVRRRI